MRSELAVCVLHGEVLLVIAHDGDEHLFGKLEVRGLESAQQNCRPFGQVRHGIDERLVLAPARAFDLARDSIERLADLLSARFNIGEDEGGF